MKIIDFLFPKVCIGCYSRGDYLCASCKKTLEPHQEICPVTHRFSPDFAVHIDSWRDVAYQWIAIGFAYNDLLKKLILQLKYYHRYDVASFLIDRLVLVIQINQILQRLFRAKRVIITSIPTHRYRKYFVKGYNQSELLASGVADKLWLQYLSLLRKNKHTRIQAFLSRQQRLKNLEGVFSVRPHIHLAWDECVVIVDDITTTGSTINEIAKELKRTYPLLTIWGVVIGRHS